MMKKVLALILVLGMVSAASATVIDVVAVDIGQSGGRLGTSLDPLEESDIIGLSIVLQNNPYPGYPAFDGYGTDAVGLDLEVSGPGSLGVVQTEVMVAPGQYEWVDDLQHHADFGAWGQPDEIVVGNAIEYLAGGVLEGLIIGQADLVWNLLLHCDGGGDVLVDLTLQDPVASRYSVYANSTTTPMEP